MVSIAPGQLRRLWCGGDRAGGHDGRQRHNHTHDLLTHTLPPHIDPRLTEPVVRIRAMPRAKPRSMARLVACAPLAPRPTTNPPAAAMADANWFGVGRGASSEEHTSELQTLMRNSYAVFCSKQQRRKMTLNIVRTPSKMT